MQLQESILLYASLPCRPFFGSTSALAKTLQVIFESCIMFQEVFIAVKLIVCGIVVAFLSVI